MSIATAFASPYPGTTVFVRMATAKPKQTQLPHEQLELKFSMDYDTWAEQTYQMLKAIIKVSETVWQSDIRRMAPCEPPHPRSDWGKFIAKYMKQKYGFIDVGRSRKSPLPSRRGSKESMYMRIA